MGFLHFDTVLWERKIFVTTLLYCTHLQRAVVNWLAILEPFSPYATEVRLVSILLRTAFLKMKQNVRFCQICIEVFFKVVTFVSNLSATMGKAMLFESGLYTSSNVAVFFIS